MQEVEFNVNCVAAYKAKLKLPDDLDTSIRGNVLAYIHDHLGQIDITNLEYKHDLEDINAVTEEDIISISNT